MRYQFVLLVFCLFTVGATAQHHTSNLALHLDGKDNNVLFGMGIVKAPWTLEAWIKSDGKPWKKTEAIFGGGEYSDLNIADNLPLAIEQGRLHNRQANVWSKQVLDDKWHHVAISCDGIATRLYLDGKMVDCKQISFSILVGALGVNTGDSTSFGGLVDEVRIWRSAVPANTLKEWMTKPLDPSHPNFKTLAAYYNFDDGMKDVGINWAGKGHQAYHLRNGRIKYNSKAPLAYTIIAANPKFTESGTAQKLFSSTIINNEWDADQGSTNTEVLKLRIAVSGTRHPLRLNGLALDLSKMNAINDISRLHVYYTGKTARSAVRIELSGNGRRPEEKMNFILPGKGVPLTSGINYFLITADIAKDAKFGDSVRIAVPFFTLNHQSYTPQTSDDPVIQTICTNSKTDPNIVRVLQFNIWHGGVHLGNDGVDRVIELVKSTRADIITMQEAYGSQRPIADSLHYFMHTASPKDNLALYSRYPVTVIPVHYKNFNSNPVMVTLPIGRQLLINGCWLRYASTPEYTSFYPDSGLDPGLWVSADSALGLVDMQNIIEKDTKPYLKNKDIPVIIGGDFNSCSHLDWTKAAAPSHFGYGPVAFPISRYLLKEGYKDSFREMNPDEVKHPEGTWAAIYGQSQYCRIDFVYYKGKGIQAIASKIVRTAPEIDDVWPSDHAAVLTTFKLTGPF